MESNARMGTVFNREAEVIFNSLPLQSDQAASIHVDHLIKQNRLKEQSNASYDLTRKINVPAIKVPWSDKTYGVNFKGNLVIPKYNFDREVNFLYESKLKAIGNYMYDPDCQQVIGFASKISNDEFECEAFYGAVDTIENAYFVDCEDQNIRAVVTQDDANLCALAMLRRLSKSKRMCPLMRSGIAFAVYPKLRITATNANALDQLLEQCEVDKLFIGSRRGLGSTRVSKVEINVYFTNCNIALFRILEKKDNCYRVSPMISPVYFSPVVRKIEKKERFPITMIEGVPMTPDPLHMFLDEVDDAHDPDSYYTINLILSSTLRQMVVYERNGFEIAIGRNHEALRILKSFLLIDNDIQLVSDDIWKRFKIEKQVSMAQLRRENAAKQMQSELKCFQELLDQQLKLKQTKAVKQQIATYRRVIAQKQAIIDKFSQAAGK